MKPKFRFRKHARGWIVEYRYFQGFWIFKKEKWKHFISVAGIEEMPWYHSELEYASMNLKSQVDFQATEETFNN